MEKIAAPTDFLGLNYYTRRVIDTSDHSGHFPENVQSQEQPTNSHTEMGWEVFPFGLYETICRAYFTYKPKEILITENGASYSDAPDENGKVHDERRINYLRSHIREVGKAINAGVPVTGYYVWALMDNFEWAFGYTQRFGLVYVDYKTQKRYPKDSAYWYEQVVRRNGLEVE